MPQISKPTNAPLDPRGKLNMEAMQVPSFRTVLAEERGCTNNILIHVLGGVGDLICAEPAVRYAVEKFYGNDVSVYCEIPELFQHLNLKNLFQAKRDEPDFDKFLVFKTMAEADSLASEFVCHLITNAVDYASLIMFRSQMQIKDRKITLKPTKEDFEIVKDFGKKDLAIHPGRGWQSKTFPKDWWDTIIFRLREVGIRPIIIGSDSVVNHGTVDVDTFGCLDLRNQLSTMQCVALLQKVGVLLTNDSSPLHMAASGDAWIGYVATAKHPDYLEHWRGDNPSFGWRMENLGLGGVWESMPLCPNIKIPIKIDEVDPDLLLSWLPEPYSVAEWGIEKCTQILV